MPRVVLALVVGLLLAGCGEPADCRRADVDAYIVAAEAVAGRFARQAEVAAATPRASLGGPLQGLLAVEEEARALTPPACLEPYHVRIVEGMALQREGLQQFAAQQGDAAAQIEAGRLRLQGALFDLIPIREGGPVPTPRP